MLENVLIYYTKLQSSNGINHLKQGLANYPIRFCMAHMVRMVSTFLMVERQSKEEWYLMT